MPYKKLPFKLESARLLLLVGDTDSGSHPFPRAQGKARTGVLYTSRGGVVPPSRGETPSSWASDSKGLDVSEVGQDLGPGL